MSANAISRIIDKIVTRQKPRILIATTTPVEVPYANAAQGGVVVSNKGRGAATVFTLPEAVPGMRVSAVVQAAQALRLDPAGSETVALPSTGVQSAAGKYIEADAVAETVDLVCITAGTWDVLNYNGTWVAES